MTPDIETVRELGTRHSNWGRWGPDDEKETLNLGTLGGDRGRTGASALHQVSGIPAEPDGHQVRI